MPIIFTDYIDSSRIYLVGVQSYPGPGVDTFFTALISDNISVATVLMNNVIVGHPDTAPNDPGHMTLIRAFHSPVSTGLLVTVFDDGTVWNLDLSTKVYTKLATLKSDSSIAATQVTNAMVFDGAVLKAFLVDQQHLQSYFVTVDLSLSPITVSSPLKLLPVQGGGEGYELPVNAHIIDNGYGKNILAVIMAGSFDQIIEVDEAVGTQTPIIFNMYDADTTAPALLYCDYGTKDCDTVWTTSAYDPVGKQLYIQAHRDEDGIYYTTIYSQYYYQQKSGTWPYFSPIVQMKFGYSGYQFVKLKEGSTLFRKVIKEVQDEPAQGNFDVTKKTKKSTIPDNEIEFAKADMKRRLQSTNPTGTIISAQFWKDDQGENHELRITATLSVAKLGTDNDVNLQTLLPLLFDSSQVFTAFCAHKRNFFVVVDNYPSANSLTAWVSTISNNADKATPVATAVQIEYPDSGSPTPLNVITPKISRILHVPDQGLMVIFTNGEAFILDIQNKQFEKRFSLITQEDLYGVTHPYATWAQTIDAAPNVLHSFIFAASNVYLVATDLSTGKVGQYIGPLKMPGTQDTTTGFSPQTLINAHMIELNGTNNLLMAMESLDSVGFDELNFVNTTSGELLGPIYNLMDDNILLMCQSYACDKWRNSVYDPVGQTLYFQGHLYSESEPEKLVLSAMVLVSNHLTGTKYWVINSEWQDLNFGYTGMQWVPFV